MKDIILLAINKRTSRSYIKTLRNLFYVLVGEMNIILKLQRIIF